MIGELPRQGEPLPWAPTEDPVSERVKVPAVMQVFETKSRALAPLEPAAGPWRRMARLTAVPGVVQLWKVRVTFCTAPVMPVTGMQALLVQLPTVG